VVKYLTKVRCAYGVHFVQNTANGCIAFTTSPVQWRLCQRHYWLCSQTWCTVDAYDDCSSPSLVILIQWFTVV